MMRTWIGVALLAVSWLLGMGLFLPASPIAWAVAILLGAVLLSGTMAREPSRREAWIALVLMIPAAWFAPWPLRAAPLLIVAGLATELAPIPRRWPKALGQGALAAGVVLLAQSLLMAVYLGQTGRSHELPWPLPDMLAGIAGLLGVEAAAEGSNVVIHSIRQVHRLGATWELLLDPASLCFYVGGLAAFGLTAWSRLEPGSRWSAWIRALRVLTLVTVVWLPVRAGLLMAWYTDRVLRWEPDSPLHVMNVFFSPYVQLALLAAPVLLAWRFVRLPQPDESRSGILPLSDAKERQDAASTMDAAATLVAALVLLAIAMLTAAVEWDPVGSQQQGRVMVVERHSDWEWTTRPYNTTWYGHDSGYNYAAAYDYCAQFFTLSRLLENQKIDDASLSACDVLVIKNPTARYSKQEVEAVLRFVERGGGLLLVGDHTNVFDCGTYLNDIARPMGFTFRHDLLFGMEDSPYEQFYVKPAVPHPAIQYLPPMDFAVSCSVDPGSSRGRPIVTGTGLWSLPAEYWIENYHPVPQHRPEMRYGAFVQVWSARYGQGRAVAFTDSTIFSTFCVFQPGKIDMLVGLLNWLNHRAPTDPRLLCIVVGALALCAGLWLSRLGNGSWVVLLGAGTCGWAVASMAVTVAGRSAMPPPEPLRPMTRVVIDRTVSDVPLAKGPYVEGDGEGYGLFELWIPRMGCYTVRERGEASFSSDAMVVICPSRSVSESFRRRLVDYVAQGGKLLVVDSPDNRASTANGLLWPFGLSVEHARPASGTLVLAGEWPGIENQQASPVTGGEAIAHLGQTPVGAVARHEKGIVMVIGFGALLNDTGMGYAGEGSLWMLQPPADRLFTKDVYARFNTEFALLRALLTGRPVEPYYTAKVVFDRTVSEVPLVEQPGEMPTEPLGFALSETWPTYLGFATARGSGAEALSGDALVVVYPSKAPSADFRQRLEQYVAGGGKLVVVDSPENKTSTANELLKPFGVAIDHGKAQGGRLVVSREEGAPWPQVEIEPAYPVAGGEPFAFLGETPVGTLTKYKKGRVAVVGFGSLWDNASMQGSWDLPPPAKSLVPYDIQSAVLRAVLTDLPFIKTLPSVGG